MKVLITYRLYRHSMTWAIVRSESWSACRVLQKWGLNLCVCVCVVCLVCVCVCVCVSRSHIHVCPNESNLNPNSNTLQPYFYWTVHHCDS